MKKAIIIQARMTSSRLPGKMMKEILGHPLIFYVIDRVKRVAGVEQVILATSSDVTDDELARFAAEQSIAVFRGGLTNVQKRYYEAAKYFGVDVIVRVTGDNPLIAPELIQDMLMQWEECKADYIGYKKCIPGAGAELFTFRSFEKAMMLSHAPYEFEHVTPPYYERQEGFNTFFLVPPRQLQCEGLRLTVDTEEDFMFMRSLYETYAVDGYVSLIDVIQNYSTEKMKT